MTLLKNTNNLLPLAKDRKVLVTGPTADSLISLNNGWTYVWQGSEESLYPKDRLDYSTRDRSEGRGGKRDLRSRHEDHSRVQALRQTARLPMSKRKSTFRPRCAPPAPLMW